MKIKPTTVRTVPEAPESWWLPWIIAAWTTTVAVIYFRARWPQLSELDHFLSVLTFPTEPAVWEELEVTGYLVWLVCLFSLWGRWIWRRMGLSFDSRTEGWMFSLAIGMGAWIGVLFAMGAIGLWRREFLVGLSIAATFAGLILNRDLAFAKGGLQKARAQPSIKFVDVLLTGALFCFLLMILLQGFAPEIFYDSLVYHLALPQFWLITHRIAAMPGNFSSAFPSNMELLYGLALAFKNDVLAKFVHFASGLGCLAAIFVLGQRHGSRRAGLMGCLFFISSPIIALEFTKSAVELGTTFFILSSLCAFLKGQDASATFLRNKWFLAAGILCGLAMGTKYTAWIFLPVLVACRLLSRTEGQSRASAAREAAYMIFWACLAVSPWIARNVLLFHNPVYPFLSAVFHSPAVGSLNFSMLQADAGSRNLKALLSWKGIWSYGTELWRITMTGFTDRDLIGPLYLMFLPWVVFLRWSQALRALGWAFLFQWVFYTLLSDIPRYWIPAAAVMSVLLAIGLVDGKTARWMKASAGGAAMWVLVSNFSAFSLLVLTLEGWVPTLGLISRSEYLNHGHNSYPAPYFSVAEYINSKLPANAGIIILGDARTFFINRRCMTASVYEIHPIFDLANRAEDEEDLYRKISQGGFEYILLNVIEEMQTRGYRRGSFTPVGRRNFERFWNRHARALFEDHGSGQDIRQVLIYELVPDQGPQQKHRPPSRNLFLALIDQ